MSEHPTHVLPSYLHADELGPWGIYLEQVGRVTPYLGKLAKWVETLKRPKRSLIVDVPVELDNGTIAHFEGYRCNTTQHGAPARAASASTTEAPCPKSRSEERRGGKGCVSTCRSRWSPNHQTNKYIQDTKRNR